MPRTAIRLFAVLVTAVLLASPLQAQDYPAERDDGLRRWHIGIDYGATAAFFGPGQISFYTIDPTSRVDYVHSTVRRGHGVGYYVSGVVEIPVQRWMDIAVKLHKQTREGQFSHTLSGASLKYAAGPSYPVTLHDDVRLQFHTFGFELLARMRLASLPRVYIMMGPSVTWVLSNRMWITQTIEDAPGTFYTRRDGTPTGLNVTNIAGADYGFESWFPDMLIGLGWTALERGPWSVVLEGYFSLPLNGMPDHDEIWTYPDASHLSARFNPRIYEGWDTWNANILRLQLGLRYEL